MNIEPNLTGGLNITLDPHENSSMLPDKLGVIIGRDVQSGTTKMRRVTIEYVDVEDKHYVITQYAEV